MRIYVTAMCLILLAGCMSAGTAVDQTKVSGFQRGKTTYSEVVAALGQPNADTIIQDGSRVIVYTHTQAAACPQSFIPIVGPLVAKADATSDNYTFTFDPSGVLVSSGSTHTQATSGTFGN